MNQLTLFDQPSPSVPVLATNPANLTLKQLCDLAKQTGQELIRFDAQPWRSQWIIKLHNAVGGGGWGYLHRFNNEADAKAKFQELLDSGNYLDA